jgi:CBS domain-containing protein
MQCSQVMKERPKCVGPAVAVSDAARLMGAANIGFLPICEPSGAVVGTVTDRDLALRVLANQLPASTAVAEVMTPELVACRATDDVEHARDLMVRHHKARIVCLDEMGSLVGVISLSDLAPIPPAPR